MTALAGLEIARIAAGAIDVSRMAELVGDWPSGSWHRPQVVRTYRQTLLRGVAAGHFIRKVTGSN